jgi:Asp/Glu/hydantoin racemase
MKILIINPNISESVTELIVQEAIRSCLAGTEIVAETADAGVAYIETRAEAVFGAHAVLKKVAKHYEHVDAVIVAAYGDPGVCAAKELVDIPVIGLTEATLAEAHLIGGRYSLVGISERIGVWYRETVRYYGFESRMASYRGLSKGFAHVACVQQEKRQMLLDLCLSCVEQDGADSIILSGAPLAGLAREIETQIPVPLIDGVGAAMRAAQSLASRGSLVRKRGSYAAPPKKESKGLPIEIERLLHKKFQLNDG